LSKLLPPDIDTDEEMLEEEGYDNAYNEEMSRAAVGRLFDDGDDFEEPPVARAFVTGYDQVPSKPIERKAERPNPQPEVHDWTVNEAGFQGRLVKDERVPKSRPRREREPEEPMTWSEEPPREREAHLERPRGRRDTETARLIMGGEDAFELGLREGRSSRERERDRRSRITNPDPKPAVRVNVASERPMQEAHQGQESRRARREEHDSAPTEEDLDGFRRKYNPGELVSSPRNPNRPIRSGQARDVRKDRMRVESRDMETVSPLRWVAAFVGVAVLAVMIFLIVQVIGLTSYRDQVEDYQSQLATASSDLAIAESRIRTLEAESGNLRDQLDAIHAQGNIPSEDGQTVNEEGTASTGGTQAPAGPTMPFTHTIASGENLNILARRFFPNEDVIEATQHIASVNGITNINNIQQGQPLTITAMGE